MKKAKMSKFPTTPIKPQKKDNGMIYPKIGLAIGSGAAKAVCQLGVLKRLIEEDIQISYVMGSSLGGLIAGFYALNQDINETIKKSLNFLEKHSVADFTNMNFFHESIFEKDFTIGYLKEVFGDATFDDCVIPFAVTAIDLESGQEVLINRGYVWEAVKASMSIPGIFPPTFLNDMYLVDGGMIEDTPVSSLRKHTDCDLIIGSTIYDLLNKQFVSQEIYDKFYAKTFKDKTFFERITHAKDDLKFFTQIISRSVNILRDRIFDYKLREARPDMLIRINSEKVNLFEWDAAPQLIKMGEDAFNEKLPELRRLIDQKIMELNENPKNVNLKVHNDGGWTTS